MVTVVLVPRDDERAAALRDAGHDVRAEPADGETTVWVARREGVACALDRALSSPATVAALVLVDPEEPREPAVLARIVAPTLVIAAPGDRLRPVSVAESHWRHIPTSRLIVETPGDVRLWERPDDLATRVTRFLREVLA